MALQKVLYTLAYNSLHASEVQDPTAEVVIDAQLWSQEHEPEIAHRLSPDSSSDCTGEHCVGCPACVPTVL